ncbi:MAG: hypothetical protein HN576_06700 [Bacteriovoracaceae bacterium]|jgi:hypothetical protein|nr:hypothetical protein [Bacteriovoracaceae bacterium]
MKWFLFIIVFLCILISAGYVGFLAPYHIYTLAIKEGLNTDFIETKVLPNEMLLGGKYKLEEYDSNGFKEYERLWRLFHFTHFQIPIPVHHPLYDIIPVIKIGEKLHKNLGIKIVNRKTVVMSKILVLEMKRLSLDLGKYKLFNLPIFKKMILDTQLNKLWDDLFFKDLTLPDYDRLGFFNYVKEIKKYSYKDLVYNLFILKMRTEMFPPSAINIGMLNETSLGIVEVQNDDKKYSKEYIYLKENNNIRILELITRKYTKAGQDYRNRVLKNIVYQESSEQASVHLYSFFRELKYSQKIDQEGMIYLFSAWSHSMKKKEFLIQMIQWLERGKGNAKQLKSLYNYALKTYGTTLSTKDHEQENAQKRLERKIKEELEDEIRDEKGTVYKIQNGKFESDEKQMQYFLQKAKDDMVNDDENEGILVVE